MPNLPTSLLYVKNGEGGAWWSAAKEYGQIHAGWPLLPASVLQQSDREIIEREYEDYYPNGPTQDRNALLRLLDHPSQHVWVTFEGGYLWWCLVRDGAEVRNDDDESKGHFWLNCEKPWSNHSTKGRLLAIPDLPGSVTTVAGFQGTVCRPSAWQSILRVIRDEPDPKILETQRARNAYQQAVKSLIAELGPKDFEHLIDMILIRSGWERVSTLGKTQEGIDLDVENLAINERAFVQVKSTAGQNQFDDYKNRFDQRRETYARMIFVVHSPNGQIHKPSDPAVEIWTGDELARLVVRLGLGERIEKMLG